MSAELLAWAQVFASLGAGGAGMGVLRWGFGVERRLIRLELRNKIREA
jgi:hypothetical protein